MKINVINCSSKIYKRVDCRLKRDHFYIISKKKLNIYFKLKLSINWAKGTQL